MKILVQRSKYSSVSVNNNIVGKIDYGLVLLVGFSTNDTKSDVEYLAKKVINLRIFDDENGIMNKSILDVGGSILSISQFTLYGDASRGNRPSYINAMKGENATHLYNYFNELLRGFDVIVEEGVFGADMLVNISNDGPVTIILESR